MSTLARRLLTAAVTVLAAGAVFTAVLSLIWPQHWPAWADRAEAAGFLTAVLLTTAAVLSWVSRR